MENKRLQICRYGSCIPAIIMMVLIFRFSAANGIESSGTSSGVLERLINGAEHIFSIELPVQEKRWFLETLETPLRKSAHIMEYMFLTFTVMLPFHMFGKNRKVCILGSVAISVFYACTDELHQYFVPGRAGRITDVWIDSIGIWLGIGIVLFLHDIVTSFHKVNS